MRLTQSIFLFMIMLYPHYDYAYEITDTTTIKIWDIQFNEIMANPTPAVSSIKYPEYVELYNRTAAAVSLKNWKLCAGTNCKTLPLCSIPADSFLVVTSAKGILSLEAGINKTGLSSFPALSNTGQLLQLINESGKLIAAVTYENSWYGDKIKKEGGFSLEQIDIANPCGEITNWKASASITGGTPGKHNSISQSNKDKQSPFISSFTIIDSMHIELLFNEMMDSINLLNPLSYTISGIGNPVTVTGYFPLYKRVLLTLPQPINSQTYLLSVSKEVMDCACNSFLESNTIKFAFPLNAEKGDLLINEVLFNPFPNGTDFLEIYNHSLKCIDLKNLYIGHYDEQAEDIKDHKQITSSSFLLFPKEYLVLTENPEIVKQHYNTLNEKAFLKIASLPSLNNDKGSVCIKSATTVIDAFRYTEEMHYALLKEKKGVSLERLNFTTPTQQADNWHSAASLAGYATPGYKNSQQLLLEEMEEEVQILPEAFSPDQDGYNDILGIHFNFNAPSWNITIIIYDDKGRIIKTIANNDLAGQTGMYTWDGTNELNEKEKTGIYIVYLRAFNLDGMLKQYKKVCVLNQK